jgi:hypothetical protein
MSNRDIEQARDQENDALVKLESEANKVCKARPDLTYAAAFVLACQRNPAAYEQYTDARTFLAKFRVPPSRGLRS